jgi:hypothetical protein
MRKQRAQVCESAKLKIGIWANANKERLAGLVLPEARDIIKSEFGVELPESALRTLYKAIGIEPKRNNKAQPQADDRSDVRQLAGIVRNLMKELGVKEVPPALDKLCGEAPVSNGSHHPRFQLQ